jgi:hypothetical protein
VADPSGSTDPYYQSSVAEILMNSSHVESKRKTAVGAWSRRELMLRGAQALSLLALPEFMIRNALAQTATFDFYISPSGSDSNAGTLAAPWALTSCVPGNPNNALMAGKRTGFLPGTYNVNTLPAVVSGGVGAYGNNLMAIPGGTASAQTYWGTCNSSGQYSARTATLAANGANLFSASNNAGGIVGENSAGGGKGYWTLDGFIIDGGGMTGGGHFVQGYYSGGVYTGSTPGAGPGIIIQNCEMSNFLNGTSGNNDGFVFFEGASGVIVQNNYFYNLQKPAQAEPHMHAIEEYGCYGNQYIYNTFANISNGATAIESKTGGAATTVAYNYFYNIEPGVYGVIMGFDGAEGSPNNPSTPYSIHHNIFDSSTQTKSVDVNSSDAQGINWYNNTIYNAPSSQFAATGASAPVQHYNNIWATTTGSTSLNFTTSSLTVCDYNCYATASRAGTTGFDTHSITSNPTFSTTIVPGNGPNQFQLASGSPCLGAGRVGGGATGAAVNMGAWDGTVTQIGCSFLSATGSSAPVVPNAPTLSVS